MNSVTYKGYQLDYDYSANAWVMPGVEESIYCLSETPYLRGTLTELQTHIDEWEYLAEQEDG